MSDSPPGGHRIGAGARAGTAVLTVVVLALVALVVLLRSGSGQVPYVEQPAGSHQLTAAAPLNSVVQDQGNSVPLPDGRTLWMFADSAQLTHRPTFFVTSSAGIATGDSLRLKYLTGASGTPIEFLPRTDAEKANQVPGDHYTAIWPTGATTLTDGRIIIAYAKYAVRFKPKAQFDFLAGGLFEYRYRSGGLHLFGSKPATRLADDLWRGGDGPVASPVYYQGYVYFYRCENFRCWSLRTTPAGLARRGAYQWWTGSGWNHDYHARVQVTFGSDVPGRNPSIAYSPALGLFTMADTSGGIQATQARIWVARDPWGPWSRAAAFPLPSCPKDGCYTINIHPQESPAGTLRVSFATNGIGPYVRVVDVPIRIENTGPVPIVLTATAPTPTSSPPTSSP